MTLDEAEALDAADPLREARGRFQLPQATIYLDGNSLGALPKATPERLAQVVEREWGEDLIASWNSHGWIDAPVRVAAKLAPLLGARPEELLVADSTSVCLFKLLAAAVRARPGRSTILSQQGNFPTDLYVAQGLVELVPGLKLVTVPAEQVAEAIDEDTAVVLLTHVDYRSAVVHDMASINSTAQAKGALTLWDLSHSAGALALDLSRHGCDLAVGCGYKYLNGGPGAPAFLYIAERLQAELRSPLAGWMGHAEPFAFAADYCAAQGITRFLTGTPSILALAALDAGLDTFSGFSIEQVETKSRRLSQLFIEQVEARCGGEVTLASPRNPGERGSHVSFAHAHGYAMIQALIGHGVIGDFREPNLMRFGFAPLYNCYADLWRAAEILGSILASGEWDQPRFAERRKVT